MLTQDSPEACLSQQCCLVAAAASAVPPVLHLQAVAVQLLAVPVHEPAAAALEPAQHHFHLCPRTHYLPNVSSETDHAEATLTKRPQTFGLRGQKS